ncbi:MAG: hypothetical protein AMJ91_02470 [candidate division Zixibacteria bacterium SM23_73_3]|nr:MAG: hypothetical protein AMJ91_02470 [candidate division Zixibacteria bacterium SM23_73_3]
MVLSFVFVLGSWFLGKPSPAYGKVSVTIYNQDLGLIKDVRELEFQKGKSLIKFTDVAARIDPTSVHFKPVNASDRVSILEQNYQYDLVSSTKILQKYVDKEIELFAKSAGPKEEGKSYKGQLLSYSNENVTLQEPDGAIRIVRLDEVRDLYFPTLPEGLITKPTLVWLLDSQVSGKRKAEVSYLTGGINWHAEYVAVVDQRDENLELAGWVSIDNRSGATYEEAKVKLIAGEVHRVREERVPPRLAKGYIADMAAGAPQFEEKAFFEYHLYTLLRPATIKDNEIKQVSLFPSTEVTVKKIFTYDGARDEKKVRVELEFENAESAGLGMPLPQGKIRVYKEDVDKALEFVGEDKIDHTPKNEKVRVFLGNAFDIVGERQKTDFKTIREDITEESYQIKLRNHKEEAVEVVVVEHLYSYTEWEIRESTHSYEKKDASTIEFKIQLDKDQEVVLNYTVRYYR